MSIRDTLINIIDTIKKPGHADARHPLSEIIDSIGASSCAGILAAECGGSDVLRLLLEHGASPTLAFSKVTIGADSPARQLRAAAEGKAVAEALAAKKAKEDASEEARIAWVSDPHLHRAIPVPKKLKFLKPVRK